MDIRNFGGPWLALELIRRLKLDEFLAAARPAGNTADVTTVEQIVTTMESRYGQSDRIWVMNRGMASEENIEFLQADGRRCILAATKLHLKKFERQLLEEDWSTIRAGLEVKLCPAPDGDDETFILCRSSNRDWSEEDL